MLQQGTPLNSLSCDTIPTCSSSFAREMEMTPAEQPMPDRLYDTTLDFILKWLTIMAESDGVGLNREQFTIKISTCTADD